MIFAQEARDEVAEAIIDVVVEDVGAYAAAQSEKPRELPVGVDVEPDVGRFHGRIHALVPDLVLRLLQEVLRLIHEIEAKARARLEGSREPLRRLQAPRAMRNPRADAEVAVGLLDEIPAAIEFYDNAIRLPQTGSLLRRLPQSGL